MKWTTKLALSLVCGALAVNLAAGPMWWGVVFSRFSGPLTSAPFSEDGAGYFRWEKDGVILRLKSLDLLFEFLHR